MSRREEIDLKWFTFTSNRINQCCVAPCTGREKEGTVLAVTGQEASAVYPEGQEPTEINGLGNTEEDIMPIGLQCRFLSKGELASRCYPAAGFALVRGRWSPRERTRLSTSFLELTGRRHAAWTWPRRTRDWVDRASESLLRACEVGWADDRLQSSLWRLSSVFRWLSTLVNSAYSHAPLT